MADYVDPILGFSLALISITYIYFAHFAMNLIPESDFAPCGRLSKQIECYNLSQDTCMAAWHSSLGDCEDQLLEIRKQRPTALMGAFLETCIGRNFDKVMRYNRINLESPACQDYFRRMGNEHD